MFLSQINRQRLTVSFIKNNQVYECGVCATDIELNDLLTLNCNHKFCKSCLVYYWESLINKGLVDSQNMKCPQDECSQEIDCNMLKQNLSSQQFQKYEKLAFDNFQVASQDEVGVNCPRSGCDARWVIWKQADYSTCPICNYNFCMNCKNKKHDQQTCEEAEINSMSEADRQFKEFIKKSNFQKCPHCRTIVEKEKFCNFIRCKSAQCNSNNCFCYLCGDKLTDNDHFTHFISDDPYLDKCKNTEKGQTNQEQKSVQTSKQVKETQKTNCQTSKCKNKAECIENFNNIIAFCNQCQKFTCTQCKKQFKAGQDLEVLNHFEISKQKQCEKKKDCVIF